MDLVRNEQLKLAATLLNNLATISIGAGVITPLVALTSGYLNDGVSARQQELIVLIGLGWIVLAGALHYMGRRVLRGLRE